MLYICSLFLKYRKLSRIFLENFKNSVLTIFVPLFIIENIGFYPTVINFILFRQMAYQLIWVANWDHSGSPCNMKFKQTLSAWKVMCTVFWHRRDILLFDFLTRGETMNAERYCETLQKMRQVIQKQAAPDAQSCCYLAAR